MVKYTHQQLKDMQLNGIQPTYEWDLLKTKYKDRWEKSAEIMNLLTNNPNRFIQDHILNHRTFDPNKHHHNQHDAKITHNRFHNKNTFTDYQGDIYGYSVEYYFKHSYEDCTNMMHTPNDIWEDYAQRKKLLISHCTRSAYDDAELDIPELEYWLDFYDDMHTILTQMVEQAFQTTDFYIRLNIIEYAYPTATKENYIEQRKFCTERFGRPHADESLGGWHLGENQNEFWMENTKTHELESVPNLEHGNTLWMFGEKAEDWIPTVHGMKHNPDPSHGVRYSLIADVHRHIASEWSKE